MGILCIKSVASHDRSLRHHLPLHLPFTLTLPLTLTLALALSLTLTLTVTLNDRSLRRQRKGKCGWGVAAHRIAIEAANRLRLNCRAPRGTRTHVTGTLPTAMLPTAMLDTCTGQLHTCALHIGAPDAGYDPCFYLRALSVVMSRVTIRVQQSNP